MSNPLGINQYTKQGGKKPKVVSARGKNLPASTQKRQAKLREMGSPRYSGKMR